MMISRVPYIKWLVILMVVAFGFGYLLFQARGLIMGPVVTIENPKNGATVFDAVLTISGIARASAQVSLNDRDIMTDTAGRFEETVVLAKGYNALSVLAHDRFGRTDAQYIELIYK